MRAARSTPNETTGSPTNLRTAANRGSTPRRCSPLSILSARARCTVTRTTTTTVIEQTADELRRNESDGAPRPAAYIVSDHVTGFSDKVTVGTLPGRPASIFITAVRRTRFTDRARHTVHGNDVDRMENKRPRTASERTRGGVLSNRSRGTLCFRRQTFNQNTVHRLEQRFLNLGVAY